MSSVAANQILRFDGFDLRGRRSVAILTVQSRESTVQQLANFGKERKGSYYSFSSSPAERREDRNNPDRVPPFVSPLYAVGFDSSSERCRTLTVIG